MDGNTCLWSNQHADNTIAFALSLAQVFHEQARQASAGSNLEFGYDVLSKTCQNLLFVITHLLCQKDSVGSITSTR